MMMAMAMMMMTTTYNPHYVTPPKPYETLITKLASLAKYEHKY